MKAGMGMTYVNFFICLNRLRSSTTHFKVSVEPITSKIKKQDISDLIKSQSLIKEKILNITLVDSSNNTVKPSNEEEIKSETSSRKL